MRTKKLATVLSDLGARLKRQHKHYVYEFPNGRNFVAPKTPSDVRAELNAIADAKKAAGVVREASVEGERRERISKPGRAGDAPWRPSVAGFALASALSAAGVTEQALRLELEAQRQELRGMSIHVATLQSRLAASSAALSELESLWWVRFGRRIKALIRRVRGAC